MSGTENVRRRRNVLAASVAAGVLLAGGGGVYLAATASGDDTGPAGRAADAAGPPPQLRLGGGGTDPGGGATTRGGPGIAPGEPDPGGGPNGTVYTAKGPLPQGPSSAAVHRPEGLVTSAEVTRLADALGVSGRPALVGDVWTIRPEQDGSGPRLDVAKRAPGNWTYSWYDGGPVGDTCLKGKACPPPGEPSKSSPGGTPLSEAAAKAAAAPVLKALGQDDAKVDASRVVNGSVRVVNADPVVGGLPTHGWSTGLHIGRDGKPVSGSGMLKAPVEGAVYPVVGASKALAALNEESKGSGPIGADGCLGKPPSSPGDVIGNGRVEGEGKPEPGGPCRTVVDRAQPERVAVTGAVFGLAARDVEGERLLVPSWLFTADPDDGAPYTVAETAVATEYLAPPAKPAPTPPPGEDGTAPARQVESYRAEDGGRKLAVTFWGGVCSTYEVTAEERPERVAVRITESPVDPDRVCVMIAKEFTRTVTLQVPLGSRPVVDAASGEAVPRR
ncbi:MULTISPECIES: hypothetical protein [unclassified Streptomyces]|uniref:hypothetical protein n=1 Tax=unclassified Streptomyces TaxID=2593676 RepID=UPI0006F36ABC|nr:MULTISPECIES: hypothetical protein [unclassified Streptomyces]KQX53303.1 hypothetical protein ASD33_08940 [Streptomyces sp. Root1304]KRA90223.1 hypothetical protein ASE09_08945 [Streptomyces sp. Root66D1]